MKTYWGDIHNHCAVSYGHGDPERVLNNARQHLDFVSITGHAFWPDMPTDLQRHNAIILYHLGGFAKLQRYWGDLLHKMEASNRPGEFVTLPSYEWHSREYGDYNAYFGSHQVPLVDGPDLAGLAARLANEEAPFILMPHHCGYPKGHRGLNWEAFIPEVTPLVEIYSNHGCGEADDAGYEYHHSMGPRVGGSMVRRGLLLGHRFGFSAGTDSHDGYPGHYGHGRIGVLAEKLDLSSIWDGMMNRRTVASTGGRFGVEFAMGAGGIGQVVGREARMPIRLCIEGNGPIERVDLIEGSNGRCRVRRLAGPDLDFGFVPGRYKVKIECGWGREKQRSDWDVSCRVDDGRLLGVERCFRHSDYPMDEMASSEEIVEQDDSGVRWLARALANPSGMTGGTHFNAGGTQAVVLDLDLGDRSRLRVTAGDVDFDLPVQELACGSIGRPISGFGSPALKLHRAVPEREFTFLHESVFEPPVDAAAGFVYARVLQSDGQMAWISPIWYE
ncbi:MAG: hypothetical protein R3F07_17200 [Opitutaceae bacterium]